MFMPIIDRTALRTALLALASAIVLGACALQPKPVPELELPGTSEQAPAALDTWWVSFADPVLDALITEALKANADMAGAIARVDASRAALDLALISRLPDASFSLDARRQQYSLERPLPNRPRQYNNVVGGFKAAYEIDLFNRLSGQRDQARQALAASRYAREGVRAALAAQVARAYFGLRALDADEALLAQTLATREAALALRERQFAAGAISRYDLEVSRSERASVAAALAPTRAAREQAETALQVLLGRSPRALVDRQPARGLAVDVLAMQPEIPAGLPADLLQRRADVRAAEADLAYASLTVEVARRQWFPTISLTGGWGGESATLGQVVGSAARTWNVGTLIAQPLVGLLTTRALVAQNEAQREQAELTYRQAARQAYADALSALSTHRGARDAMAETQQLFDANSRARQLAELSYNAGKASRLTLLDAERERLSAERALIGARRDRLLALVDVYQALGGGWSGSLEAPASDEGLENSAAR